MGVHVTRTAQAFGRVLKEKRESEGNSVRQVALAVGIDRAIVWRIERGENKISFENAMRLCEYYGFDLSVVAKNYVVRNKRGQLI